jgi:integrase
VAGTTRRLAVRADAGAGDVRPAARAGGASRETARLAGVPDAALHRLRHAVAVVLVAEGKLLAAQHRLGHRDLSTTLRHYGWAQAPGDTDVADHLDWVLNRS